MNAVMEHGSDGILPANLLDPASARIVARRDGARLELDVHGEADVSTSPGLRADLLSWLEDGVHEVLVDVSGLSFCDLAGSDVLHDLVEEGAACGVRVEICGMSPLLAIVYTTFPPRGPADPGKGRRFGRSGPVEHESSRGGPQMEPSGGLRDR